MADHRDPTAATHATATGHALSAATWLDNHFARSRGIYEAMARAVGLESGWRGSTRAAAPALSCRCSPRSSAPPAR